MKSILEIKSLKTISKKSQSFITGGTGSQGCDGELCVGEILENGECSDGDVGGN